MPQQTIAPSDCALALAVPVEKKEFLHDLDRSDRWDFAPGILRRYPGVRPEGAWELYAPQATEVLRVCDEVERRGVTVLRKAGIEAFPRLFEQFRVVTIVAHWRCLSVGAADILDVEGLLRAVREARPPNPMTAAFQLVGAPGFLARVPQSASRVPFALREVFERKCPRLLDPAVAETEPTESLRTAVAEQIDAIVAAAHASFQQVHANAPPKLLDAPRFAVERLHRVAFELAFPEAIAGGPAIEFRNGLHCAADLIEKVPEDFSGVIDATICNSTILGHAIKSVRTGGLVLVSSRPVDIDVRLSAYNLVITLLSRVPMSFSAAHTHVYRELRRNLA